MNHQSDLIYGAEQQLTGFAAAKYGGIEDLADSMGLTAEEWRLIKTKSSNPLSEEDTEALDKLFS